MSNVIEKSKFTCAISSFHTVLAIEKGIPILHCGPGCAGNQLAATAMAAGYQGEGYAGGGQLSCTNTTQTEVVFGGEAKLRATIEGTLKVIKGDLYVVQSGCTAGIIGDDVESVAGEFADRGYPIVGVDTAGFRGNNYLGHELVVNAIIDQFVGDAEPNVRKGLVNVFSVVPFQDPYWRGDLEEIKRILEGIGLEVHVLYGYSSDGVAEWKDIPNAQFNLVIGPWIGVSSAKLCEKLYGTPYLHIPVLPVGLKETDRFLRKVAEFAGISEESADKFIKKEESRYKKYFVSMGDLITDFASRLPLNLYTIADSFYGLGLTKFMTEELGFEPRKLYAIENPDNSSREIIQKAAQDIDIRLADRVSFEYDNALIIKEIRKDIEETGIRSVILGSTWDEELRGKYNNLIVSVSNPVADKVIMSRTYVGYNGGLNLIEDIYSDLFSQGQVSTNSPRVEW